MAMWPLKNKAADRPDPTIMTERLCIRPALLQDYDQWRCVRAKNQAYLKPFEPAWPSNALSLEFFVRRTARLAQDRHEDRTYAFIILKRTTEDLIGGININNVVRGAGQQAALGYWLDEDSQGYGYMHEAANGVLNYAFTHLALARMNASTLPHNVKSMNMLKRLGFEEEGFAKKYIQIDGERRDHILFGLNADDFLRASRNAR